MAIKLNPRKLTIEVSPDDLRKQAATAVSQAKDWAVPRVEKAVDWAVPQATRLYERGVKATAPRIESAARKVVPAVDATHDKIVDDLVPWIVNASKTAAEEAVVALETVRRTDAAKSAKTAAKEIAKVSSKKSHPIRNAFMFVASIFAVAGVGYYLFQRLRPVDDPWDDDSEWIDFTDDAPNVGDMASAAVDSVKSSASSFAQDATDTVKDAADNIADSADKVVKSAKRSAHRAASKVADAASTTTEQATKKASELAAEALRSVESTMKNTKKD